MSETDLVPVLASVLAAVVLALGALRAALDALPARDARRRDRPPRLWRVAGVLTAAIARVVDPLLPALLRSAAARLLRHAGLDSVLDPADLVAGCLFAAIGLGALGAFGAASARAGESAVLAASAGALLGAWLPLSWAIDRRAARHRAIARALPFYLDVITLSVESGAHLNGALQHAVLKGPAGPLQDELGRVLRDVRTGRARADALRAMADRVELPSMASWVAALIAAERNGASLGPILRAQAEQRRQERFQRAEELAMKAPVKMLAPLLLCFFPCTFVLLFFPVVVRLIEEGLLR